MFSKWSVENNIVSNISYSLANAVIESESQSVVEFFIRYKVIIILINLLHDVFHHLRVIVGIEPLVIV